MIGVMPVKDMLPKVYEGKIEEWRDWKDVVEDYTDMIKPGMKELMKEAEKEAENIGINWEGVINAAVAKQQNMGLWRLLKQRTEGEARKVVLTVEEGAGFAAWQTLCKRMGPSLEARKAKVMAEVSTVGKAANPGELRWKMTELEQRIRRAMQIAGEHAIGPKWKLQLLRGIMDNTTQGALALQEGLAYEAPRDKAMQ